MLRVLLDSRHHVMGFRELPMLARLKSNVTRRRLWITLAALGVLGLLTVWCAGGLHSDALPREYLRIEMGMKIAEAKALLDAGFYQPFKGPGFSGRQEHQQETFASALLRGSSTAEWHRRHHNITWRGDTWAIVLVVDADDSVAGKSLIRIDHGEFSLIRNPMLWIRRRLGGVTP